MRIAVDARQIFRSERRGIGKTLVPLYATLAALRPRWQFILLHQLVAEVPELALANVRTLRLDTPGAHRLDSWERIILPAAAWASRADVLHAPANTGPSWSRVPVALTVHDLIPAESRATDPAARDWLKRVRRSAHAARVVMTATDFTRADLATKLGLDPGAIAVTPWAPAAQMRPIADPAELLRVRAAYGLAPTERYIFGFGAADPRKNTPRLIRAFAALPHSIRDSTRLLLVGIQPGVLTEFQAIAETTGARDRVILSGFATETDLPALLSGATVMAFPSQNEGFGLPLLDAFACGTAVLTGDRTSLPEVAADAALLCDPFSDDSVRDGLARLLDDDALRQDLATRGLARARAFNWTRTADTMARVFEHAIDRKRK